MLLIFLDRVNREVCSSHCYMRKRYGNRISQSHDRKWQTLESGLTNNSAWSLLRKRLRTRAKSWLWRQYHSMTTSDRLSIKTTHLSLYFTLTKYKWFINITIRNVLRRGDTNILPSNLNNTLILNNTFKNFCCHLSSSSSFAFKI